MNSQPLNNDQLYAEYKDACAGVCEIGWHIGVAVRDGKPMMPAENVELRDDLQTHHIFSLSRRPDRISNLIVLTARTHELVQSIEPQKGRLLCILAKLRKRAATGNPDELNVAELDLCAGKYSTGVIEFMSFQEDRWRNWQQECLRRLEAAKLDDYIAREFQEASP